MRLLPDTFQMLDSVLARRFQLLFPDGLEGATLPDGWEEKVWER